MRTMQFFQVGILALLLSGCATGPARVQQRNRELIGRYFEGWANRGDPRVAAALIATNVVLYNPPAVVRSLEDYQRGMAVFHRAFPDLHYTIDDEVAERDRVAVRWTLRATNLGEYQGRPASGQVVTVTGTSTFRIAGGKIQEIWVNMDRVGMMQQMGWLPGPPATPVR